MRRLESGLKIRAFEDYLIDTLEMGNDPYGFIDFIEKEKWDFKD